jgi:hypothetical protein
MRCLFLLAFVLAVAQHGGEARSRDVFDDNLRMLNFKRVLHDLIRNELGNVRVTKPLSNKIIESMLGKIPQVGNNQACLESESCALDWMGFYNLALQKISEKSAVLEVRDNEIKRTVKFQANKS